MSAGVTEQCPECGARVFSSDTACMSCGAELHLAPPRENWEDMAPPEPITVEAEPQKPAPQHWKTAGSMKPLAPILWLMGAHQALAWLIALCTWQPLRIHTGYRSMYAVLPWSHASSYQAPIGSFEWYLVPVLAAILIVVGIAMWTGGADAAICERRGVKVGDSRWTWRFWM